MRLTKVYTERGWKTPLEITPPGGTIDWFDAFNMIPGERQAWYPPNAPQVIPRAELICERVLGLTDYPSFRRFCLRYGLIMLHKFVEAYLKGSRPENLREPGFFEDGPPLLGLPGGSAVMAVTSIPESNLMEIWEGFGPGHLDWYREHINETLKGKYASPLMQGADMHGVDLQMSLLNSKVKVIQNPNVPEEFTMYIHAEGLFEACDFELSEYSGSPVDVCARPGCGHIFIKRRSDRVYCSPACRPRKESDLRREKKRVYNRLNYLWRSQLELAKKVDDKTREKLGEAGTVDEVKAVVDWLEKQVSKDKAQGRR
jgi:hypothetical protein